LACSLTGINPANHLGPIANSSTRSARPLPSLTPNQPAISFSPDPPLQPLPSISPRYRSSDRHQRLRPILKPASSSGSSEPPSPPPRWSVSVMPSKMVGQLVLDHSSPLKIGSTASMIRHPASCRRNAKGSSFASTPSGPTSTAAPTTMSARTAMSWWSSMTSPRPNRRSYSAILACPSPSSSIPAARVSMPGSASMRPTARNGTSAGISSTAASRASMPRTRTPRATPGSPAHGGVLYPSRSCWPPTSVQNHGRTTSPPASPMTTSPRSSPSKNSWTSIQPTIRIT